MLAVVHDSVKRGIGREHAGLDGGVAAFDARGVEVARLAADQRASGEHGFWQAQDATGRDGACAVAEALAAFEVLANFGVGFPALEFFERAQPRVRVVETNHETERHLVVVSVIEKRAAVGGRIEWPTGGVHHQSRLVFGRVDLPQLFQSDAVALWVTAFIELEAGDQLLAQVATRALGKDRVLAVQLHADLEVLAGLAVFADTEVAGCHALDRAIGVVEHFSRGKAWEYLHAQALGLLRKPAHHVAKAHDVVAVVLEAIRQ